MWVPALWRLSSFPRTLAKPDVVSSRFRTDARCLRSVVQSSSVMDPHASRRVIKTFPYTYHGQMASGPERGAKLAAPLKEKYTFSLNPAVLAEVDAARGAAGRSTFVELACRLLLALLAQGEAKAAPETGGATRGDA